MGLLQSIWTLVVFVAFVAILLWAWSKRRSADFEAASRIPLDDETPHHTSRAHPKNTHADEA